MFSSFSIPLTVSLLIIPASHFQRPWHWAQPLLILFSLWICSGMSCLGPVLPWLFSYTKTPPFEILSSIQQCSPKVLRRWGDIFTLSSQSDDHSTEHVQGNWGEAKHLLTSLSSKPRQGWVKLPPCVRTPFSRQVSALTESQSEKFCSTKSLVGSFCPVKKHTLILSLGNMENQW